MSGLGGGHGAATVNSIPERSMIDRLMAGYRQLPDDSLRKRIASLMWRRMKGLGAMLREDFLLSGSIEKMYEVFHAFEQRRMQSGAVPR